MQKACGFAACNHCDSPQTCGLNKLGIGCRGNVFSVGGDPDITDRKFDSKRAPAADGG